MQTNEDDSAYVAALAWARQHGFDGDALPPGKPGNARACPLARATGLIVYRAHARRDDESDDYVEIPDTVGEFICRFDRGEYPELLLAS